MAVEARRGCGYRKVGGMYLVGGALSSPCGMLPVPFKECGTCGHQVSFKRGLFRMTPMEALAGVARHDVDGLLYPCKLEQTEQGCSGCPLRKVAGYAFFQSKGELRAQLPKVDGKPPQDQRVVGAIWVGERFYPTPEHCALEAKTMGVSKRISQVPDWLKIGETVVMLVHQKAIEKDNGQGGVTLSPGIFSAFVPKAIEKIVSSDSAEASPEGLKELEEQGFTPVVVPGDDPDHRAR